jgi:hypothetical protein
MMTSRIAAGGWLAAMATLALIGALASPESAAAQGAARSAAKGAAAVPRTPWGVPDLQGIWTNSTTTPLERPGDLADKAELTEEERRLRDAEVASRVSFDRSGSLPGVGAYNEFWMERGALNHRTSLVIDPPDGKIPPLTAAGQARANAVFAARKSTPADSPEDLTAYDRCISRGLPGAMLPGFYNHNYQIVQTRDHVMILVEMIHDARIIPLNGRPHGNGAVRSWLGDSRGRWDGDTLVVETRNVNDKVFEVRGVLFGVGADLHLVERFRRTGPDTIEYQFTVNAPNVYTRPWTVLTPMARIDGPVFEYACHEGNYSVPNILKGARAAETGSRN